MAVQIFENIKETVIDHKNFKMYRFSDSTSTGRPVLVIPPHAGRHGNISQRIIDTCVSKNVPVYGYDLLPATQENKGVNIADLVRFICDMVTEIGEPVDLVCLCQGAWVGAIFAALHPGMVERYANFAGPINTLSGQKNNIEEYMVTKPFGQDLMDFHRNIVESHRGIQPGYMQWLAFSMVDPVMIYFDRWAKRFNLALAGDTEGLAKWTKNNDWYDFSVDLDGAWFLEALEHHFRDNLIFKGEMSIDGREVHLEDITAECFLYAGEDDNITSIKQVFDMATKLKDGQTTMTVFPGAGHTKVFVGKKELETFAGHFFE
jgi:poly(3-hydroxyalkanoate) synthetase